VRSAARWATATTTGTPDYTAIDYVQVTLNVTGTMSGCKVNGINSILGTILDYEYYSTCLFRNSSTGAFQETISDDADLINLGLETYNLIFNLTSLFAIQQQQGVDAVTYDGTFFQKQYDAGVAKYKLMYKSQVQKPQTTYYRTPDVSNRRFIGRRFNY
jgi:hypothetical protein